MMWSYILKLVVLLPLVCGLMIGCLYRMLKVQETMMISPGLRMAVLEFEGRKLLVAVGRGGVTLIDKVEGR
jgi:flagellar protein FliO/FliZ